MFRYLILGMLRPGTRQHGYALVKTYRERSGVDVSTGNFYRELQRLVLDGLIRSADNPPDADARRTPYEITPLGASVFDEWLTAHDAAAGGWAEDEISARLLFADEAEAATMLRVLDRLQENVWFYGKSLERARRQALAESEGPDATTAFRVRPLLLGRRLKHVAADIEFLGELRATYQAYLDSAAAPVVANSDSEPARALRAAARRRR
ncbi:MAG TPA: PadR family transcriptional regulator [Candidatus Dormibacteraeota bacterium]|nr:PadR family transcriptional regulator [Candidatus Dormibacteraeota bacterium]